MDKDRWDRCEMCEHDEEVLERIGGETVLCLTCKKDIQIRDVVVLPEMGPTDTLDDFERMKEEFKATRITEPEHKREWPAVCPHCRSSKFRISHTYWWKCTYCNQMTKARDNIDEYSFGILERMIMIDQLISTFSWNRSIFMMKQMFANTTSPLMERISKTKKNKEWNDLMFIRKSGKRSNPEYDKKWSNAPRGYKKLPVARDYLLAEAFRTDYVIVDEQYFRELYVINFCRFCINLNIFLKCLNIFQNFIIRNFNCYKDSHKK